jgi:hypothetical protein
VFARYLKLLAQTQALRDKSWRAPVLDSQIPAYYAAKVVASVPIAHAVSAVAVLYTVAGKTTLTTAIAFALLAAALAVSVWTNFNATMVRQASNELAILAPEKQVALWSRANVLVYGSWAAMLAFCVLAGVAAESRL